jgi:hypothetical protein
MARTQRKDYAADAVVDPSNETVKRVNFMNTPFSVQATGLDLPQVDSSSPAQDRAGLIEINSANLDAMVLNTRVLQGNREGFVSAINKPVGTLIDLDITFPKQGQDEEVTVKYTKAEILVSPDLFFTTP